MALNVPPTNTCVPSAVSADTLPNAVGFHDVASPVPASRAATRLRLWPPIVRKSPPAYTFVPEIASALTMFPAFGFQLDARPVDAESAAIRLRGCPPTL